MTPLQMFLVQTDQDDQIHNPQFLSHKYKLNPQVWIVFFQILQNTYQKLLYYEIYVREEQ